MERNARVILVSSFVLFTLVALFTFYRWIANPVSESSNVEGQVQFEGSVSGLAIGSEVRYLGVPVGRVAAIALSKALPGRVDVTVSNSQAIPAAAELVGVLTPLGITGLSVIELQERSQDMPGFAVDAGVIPGYPSLLNQLSGSASTIAQSVNTTLTRVNALLDEKMIDDLGATVGQLRILSRNLAASTGDIETLVGSATRVSLELERTLPQVRGLAKRLENDLIPSISSAGQSVQSVSEVVSVAVQENSEQLQRVMRKDLPTLVGLTDELARTLREFNKMVGNINEEPGALFYGEQVREVEIGLE
jgi:phospholipid/cholesterol/gamma-HCH transport system substrate-binding protein